MRFKPDDSVAIVTGASSGIGRCLCELLVAKGATVVATARREHRLSELVQSAVGKGSIIPVAGDITDPALRERLIEVAREVASGNDGGNDGGRVDLLVNNAGIGAIGPFADASPDRLRQIMEVNFFAPLELTRSCLPLLRSGRSPSHLQHRQRSGSPGCAEQERVLCKQVRDARFQ